MNPGGRSLSRRKVLAISAASAAAVAWPRRTLARRKSEFSLATFSADVTVPMGHPLMGGGIAPASAVTDPLFAHGIVLAGAGPPLLLVAVDWCEIRNAALEQWRERLAEAAGTLPDRVLVSSVHQHDAPVADLEAQRLLEERRLEGRVCDVAFHERAVAQVAQAVKRALPSAQPITHVGAGQARVERVASNRRYFTPDGSLHFDRTSSTKNAAAQAAEEGTIDPWLKTLSFWHNDRPVAALHAYATHPMSYYGQGSVSADFVGAARSRRQQDDPAVHQVYFSGASGNVTAGKYNDGSPANRPVLADRIYQAMRGAWEQTQRQPLDKIELVHTPVRLEPRNSAGFSIAELEAQLAAGVRPFSQCLAAMGLAWRRRADQGQQIDLPVVDFGPAQFVQLPGESYVEYQLAAQKLQPDSLVLVAGYGECATGYVPTERAWQEHDTNLRDWCWVDPGAEAALTAALARALAR